MAFVTAWVTKSYPDTTVMIFPAWFAYAFSGLGSVCVLITDGTVARSWAVTFVERIIWMSSTGEITEFLNVVFAAFASPSGVTYTLTIASVVITLIIYVISSVSTMCVLHTVDTVVVGVSSSVQWCLVITAKTFVVTVGLVERAVLSGEVIIT